MLINLIDDNYIIILLIDKFIEIIYIIYMPHL